MATVAATPKNTNFILPLLAGVSALIVVGVQFGWTLALGMSDRTAFFVLVFVGMSMCGLSPLGKGTVYGWFNPRHLLGYGLGALALYLAAAVAFHLPLPEAITTHSAVPALAGIMVVKMLVAALYPRRA